MFVLVVVVERAGEGAEMGDAGGTGPGGGGKGMRAVHEPKMLRTEYEAAAREATAAFGDGTVYVERLLTGARHVEIQVMADSLGNLF